MIGAEEFELDFISLDDIGQTFFSFAYCMK